MPIRITKAGRAQKVLEEGIALHDAGDDAGALAAYALAIALRPDWAAPWYNTGLVHKYNGQWQASFDANLRAHTLDPRDEAACWNLGIAATALGDWSTARRAWKDYGIAVPDGEGPVDYYIGLTPIRVGGREGAPEVVWADRIDPARAIVRNVPTPACGRRYGDLVLHDGAPNGYRMLDGQERAVFDELDVIAASDYATYEAVVEGAPAEEVEAFAKESDDLGIPAENWTESVRMLCKACSEGRPHEGGGHNHPPRQPSLRGEIRLGIAARDGAAARQRVETWARRLGGAALIEFNCVLPGAPRH
jgi:tetratricopeptide (TPR) repeat protein